MYSENSIQAVIGEAQLLLQGQGPEFQGRKLYAAAPVDPAGAILRISSDYSDGDKHYGLKTEWWLYAEEPAVITPQNVAAAFAVLKNEYTEVEPHALWLPTSGYRVFGSVLYKDTDTGWKGTEREMVLILPEQGGSEDVQP